MKDIPEHIQKSYTSLLQATLESLLYYLWDQTENIQERFYYSFQLDVQFSLLYVTHRDFIKGIERIVLFGPE